MEYPRSSPESIEGAMIHQSPPIDLNPRLLARLIGAEKLTDPRSKLIAGERGSSSPTSLWNRRYNQVRARYGSLVRLSRVALAARGLSVTPRPFVANEEPRALQMANVLLAGLLASTRPRIIHKFTIAPTPTSGPKAVPRCGSTLAGSLFRSCRHPISLTTVTDAQDEAPKTTTGEAKASSGRKGSSIDRLYARNLGRFVPAC